MGPRGIAADRVRSVALIERTAREVRAVLAPTVGASDRISAHRMFEYLEDYRIVVRGQQLQLSPDVGTVSDGVEGYTFFERETSEIVVRLSEETYRALERGAPRASFTASHEVGHAVQHASELVRLGRLPHDEAIALRKGMAPTHQVQQDTEWQADIFAGALLVPASGLARLDATPGTLTAAVIMAVYGVSVVCANLRLATYREHKEDLLSI
jgi:hypothetical protein